MSFPYLRLVHPAAWGGLLLHATLLYMMYTLTGAPREALSAEELALVEMTASALPVLVGLLALQALSLALILSGSRFGIVAALISACLMIPIGFIYGVGCLLTYYAIRLAPFERVPRGPSPGRAFPSACMRPLRIGSAVGIAGGLICLFLLRTPFFGLFLGCGCLALYLALRVAANPPLALGRDELILTPALLAGRVRLPYASIRKATLFDNQRIRFAVETPEGVRELEWSLESVRAGDRRDAFEGLAEALGAADVPMS